MAAVEIVAIEQDEADMRLDRWFRRRFPHLTHGQIEKLLRTGQARLDGARADGSSRVQPGQKVRVPPLPDRPPRKPAGALDVKDEAFVQSLVLHKDDEIIAINKPHGLAVQGGPKTIRHVDALLDGLRFGLEERPKLVHRLDRDTSGVLLLARSARAAAFLTARFRDREAEKIYWAVVAGAPKPEGGQIRGWMRKAPGALAGDRELVRSALQSEEGAVFAVTDYQTISRAAHRAAWVALRPETGRTHQLRFHMAEVGNAIVGDPKYRSDKAAPDELPKKLHLHARALRLRRANGALLKVVAPLPEHMKKSFEILGFLESEARNPFGPFEG